GQGGLDPTRLRANWIDALNKGLRSANLASTNGVQFSLPYYGDALDRFVAQFDLPVGIQVVAKGGTMDARYAAFRAQIAEEIVKKTAIPNAEIGASAHVEVTEKSAQNWGWVRAMVRAIDRRIPSASGFTIEKFIRDVFLYTQRDVVRRAIDQI